MKNISLILNILLLLAVAYLYIDRFSGSGKEEVRNAAVDNVVPTSSIKIMYLNIDSLHAKSEEFQKKSVELEQRQAGAEATFRKKLKTFENEVVAFQRNQQSGNMTPKSAQEVGARLAKKEQDLVAQQEAVAKDLLQATEEFNITFNMEVRGYLDSLKQANHYDYVLVAGAGSQVLTANNNFDLTNQVVELMNRN